MSVGADAELEAPTKVAIKAWNVALERGPCPVVIYWRFDTGADVFVSYGDPPGDELGHKKNQWVTIDRSQVQKDRLATVIAHEIGHEIGLPHDRHATDERELMFHEQTPLTPPEPTGWDVAWVCHGR